MKKNKATIFRLLGFETFFNLIVSPFCKPAVVSGKNEMFRPTPTFAIRREINHIFPGFGRAYFGSTIGVGLLSFRAVFLQCNTRPWFETKHIHIQTQ